MYQDVAHTYTNSHDLIYKEQWDVENNKATRIATNEFSRILMSPTILEGTTAKVRVKKGAGKGQWYVGITKEEIEKTHKMLGREPLDWSFFSLGCKVNNNTWTAFHDELKEGETVTMIVDRTLGTIDFGIHGVYKEAF